MYESKVSFTFDTICPWTYIAKKRLGQALDQIRSSSVPVTFTLHFEPYQLNSHFSSTADKQEWQLHHKHLDNAEAQKLYQRHMASLGEPLGINFRFDGPMGNTFEAHRVIQHFQEKEGAEETTSRLVDALYRKYFEEARHPTEDDTLIEACVEAGIDEEEARQVVQLREKVKGLRGNAFVVWAWM